jgi:WD40 repeat protein
VYDRRGLIGICLKFAYDLLTYALLAVPFKQAKALHQLSGHKGPVVSVGFYNVGSNVMLASGSVDKTVLLWDTIDGKCVGKLEGHQVRFLACFHVIYCASCFT